MATNNRGGNRRRQTGSKNNNPRGRNQTSSRSLSSDDSVTRPLAAAIGAAAAVGGAMFLWSRRNEISEQISDLSEQLNQARQSGRWTSSEDDGAEEAPASTSRRRGSGRSQVEIAEEALTLKEIGAAS
jgi:hypothetical protein